MSTQESKLDEPRLSFWKGQLSGIIVNLVLAVAIVLSVLWLPPISLTKRLAEGGYTVLGEGILSVVDPDGTQFTVLPEGLTGSLKAKLTSVPRLDFLDGTAGEDLLAAAESVPSFLEVKSPLYRLTLRGEQPTAALLTFPSPMTSRKPSGWTSMRGPVVDGPGCPVRCSAQRT